MTEPNPWDGVLTPAPPLDLKAVAEKWLTQCGACDVGLPMGCNCPDGDYRPVMSQMLAELEQLRELRARVEEYAGEVHRVGCDCGHAAFVHSDALGATGCTGGLSLCPCMRGFSSIVGDQLRALLALDGE